MKSRRWIGLIKGSSISLANVWLDDKQFHDSSNVDV